MPGTIRATSGTCDRCGQDATIKGAGHRDVVWGEVEGYVQGAGKYVADLCATCVAELREWIDAGSGRGFVPLSVALADQENYETLTPLEESLSSMLYDLTSEQRDALFTAIRARGAR